MPLLLLAALLFAPIASATPDEPEEVPEVDVSSYRSELVLLDDGDGHLIAFRESAPREVVFFGDRKHLYEVQSNGSSASGTDQFHVNILDFRDDTRRASFSLREGTYSMGCGDQRKPMTLVPQAEAKRIVASATFHEHRWRRNAVALYRDEYGVYYFIDRATGDDRNADHRVYVGWQGQILRSPLKMLASDSLGRVYSAGNGTRRLVITGDTVRYIEGDAVRELHALDLVMDGPYLYTQLGVYPKVPHGNPCDAWLVE